MNRHNICGIGIYLVLLYVHIEYYDICINSILKHAIVHIITQI